jgi:hypothetical protein
MSCGKACGNAETLRSRPTCSTSAEDAEKVATTRLRSDPQWWTRRRLIKPLVDCSGGTRSAPLDPWTSCGVADSCVFESGDVARPGRWAVGCVDRRTRGDAGTGRQPPLTGCGDGRSAGQPVRRRFVLRVLPRRAELGHDSGLVPVRRQRCPAVISGTFGRDGGSGRPAHVLPQGARWPQDGLATAAALVLQRIGAGGRNARPFMLVMWGRHVRPGLGGRNQIRRQSCGGQVHM